MFLRFLIFCVVSISTLYGTLETQLTPYSLHKLAANGSLPRFVPRMTYKVYHSLQSLEIAPLAQLLQKNSAQVGFEEKGSSDPISALWLTWESDPTTTMTIRWISSKSHTDTKIEYWETPPYLHKPKKIFKETGTCSF